MANTQRTILVTGAASGIGRETARLFAARGWFVGLADVDRSSLTALAGELGPARCMALALDVSDVTAWPGAISAFSAATNGRLDVLFNNAGIARMGLNRDIAITEQHRVVDVNLKGVLNGVAKALPLLEATPQARIINMSSTSSLYGVPELAVYSATKHAIRALTEALSLELEHLGIAVCDVVAPYVRTPLVTAAERQAYSVAATGVNLGPEQIARVVWRAAHGRRLHWRVHPLTHLLAFVFWLLPAMRRTLVRRLCLSPEFRRGVPTVRAVGRIASRG